MDIRNQVSESGIVCPQKNSRALSKRQKIDRKKNVLIECECINISNLMILSVMICQ